MSWSRVASGLEKVARAAARQNGDDTIHVLNRVVEHVFDIAARVSTTTRHDVVPTTNASVDKQQHTIIPSSSGTPLNNVSHNEPSYQQSHTIGSSVGGRAAEPALSSDNPVAMNDESDASRFNRSSLNAENESTSRSLDNQASEASLLAGSDSITPSPPGSITEAPNVTVKETHRHIQEGSAVPSSRVGRAMGFANLGLGLAVGSLAEGASRLLGLRPEGDSVVLSDANSDRLVVSLCRMRGAALKMGQMLSIQDDSLLPKPLSRALARVRQGAEAMPKFQLESQLVSQLGTQWRDNFVIFDDLPFAAASIGQVHRAVIHRDNVDQQVVVKVQYPGVAQSIESDFRNLATIVRWSGLSPKGLFIENVIRVGRQELQVECDYQNEMRNQNIMKGLVDQDPILHENCFHVPTVIESLTTDQILTSEYLPGGTIDKITNASQEERNRIGRTILYLTMKELFEWRFMQTDPNWGNFLYDVGTKTTGLIDFGAARHYPKDFVDGYLRIVWANANRDEETLMEQSHKMGFLTGDENEDMMRAHLLAGFTMGEPFQHHKPFDFRGSRISERLGEHTSVFLQHRLTPPPEEIYTLHRKLAGAYMLCIKLGATVPARDLLEQIVANHTFDDGRKNPITGL